MRGEPDSGYHAWMPDPADARDVESLTAMVAAGARAKYVFFWGHTAKVDGAVGSWAFSQWYPSPFTVDGQLYRTAEHWMMAEKARLFGDEERCAKILSVHGPGDAKAHGRRIAGFSEEKWEAHRFEIVVEGNVHKFSQHPELGEFLRGTAKRVLVETSPVDRVWGIGLAHDDARASDPARWRGLNLLGFALMEARARLP